MVMHYILADDAGSGPRRTLVNTDDLVVGANATVVSTNLAAIEARGWNNSVSVRGAVFGNTEGILVGPAPNGAANEGSVVRVQAGGVVYGNLAGVAMQGWGHGIHNAGEISSFGVGIDLVAAGPTAIVNLGLVSAQTAIRAASVDATDNSVTLINRGAIVGTGAAYAGGGATDRFINRGTVDGDVWLGHGNNQFDNRGGTVEGLVSSGTGVDWFQPGAGEDWFDGGAGAGDILDLRAGPGGRVSLVDDSGTGWAAGDTYANFEQVWGSREAADTILGSGAANTLNGFGGVDSLRGEGGADWLDGGLEADRLCGGRGDDSFVFHDLAESGDAILDFRNRPGDDDAIWIRAAGFGGGLTATRSALPEAKFQSRTDNKAQDGDDRFIFRTTDATLWFDVDGKGGEGAALVADLQAGAVLAAADIMIF